MLYCAIRRAAPAVVAVVAISRGGGHRGQRDGMTEGRTEGRAGRDGGTRRGGEGHQGETDRLAQASLRPHPRSYFRTNLWECPREQGRTDADEEEGKKLRWVVGNGRWAAVCQLSGQHARALLRIVPSQPPADQPQCQSASGTFDLSGCAEEQCGRYPKRNFRVVLNLGILGRRRDRYGTRLGPIPGTGISGSRLFN